MKHPVDTSKWGEFVVGELFELTGIKQVKSQHTLSKILMEFRLLFNPIRTIW